jgi:hypothetical protein
MTNYKKELEDIHNSIQDHYSKASNLKIMEYELIQEWVKNCCPVQLFDHFKLPKSPTHGVDTTISVDRISVVELNNDLYWSITGCRIRKDNLIGKQRLYHYMVIKEDTNG